MGLCKCPKRKVTNQFCFEHRVNVCEWCMVSSHATCPVKSYLQWLQDSDYNPNCLFCDGALAGEDCVRLVCYCIFRWSCLDKYCRSLPKDTAPAGYVCPTPGCNTPIFPPDNLVSPVADKLRSVLQDVNWARAGLGLPLLSDKLERKPVQAPSGPRPSPEGEDVSAHEMVDKTVTRERGAETVVSLENFDTRTHAQTVRRSGVEMSDLARSPLISGSNDPDSQGYKYKRRSAADWFLRWWRTLMKPAAQRRRSLLHLVILIVLIATIFLSIIYIFNYFGRSGRDDPMLDPFNNPNIRVKE